MEKIAEKLAPELSKLESFLTSSLRTEVGFIRTVSEYVIKAGGKRIRPILLILSCRLCGDTSDRYLPYAASIEFIHTATLLHDDVIDDAKVRRGKSTANVLFGNPSTILIGDFLYSRAFDLMVSEGSREILAIMARATNLLSEGEILELIMTGNVELKEEEYLEIIEKKTAVLFSAACEIGAILGAAPSDKREALSELGRSLGLIFQIKDDVLDYTSSEQILGKKIGTDLKEGKVTLPLIKALREANRRERVYLERVLRKKAPAFEDFERVRGVIEKYNGIAYALSLCLELAKKAREELLAFPDNPYRQDLLALIDYLVERER
jgi:octaprenyl-diphosphate synthase